MRISIIQPITPADSQKTSTAFVIDNPINFLLDATDAAAAQADYGKTYDYELRKLQLVVKLLVNQVKNSRYGTCYEPIQPVQIT